MHRDPGGRLKPIGRPALIFALAALFASRAAAHDPGEDEAPLFRAEATVELEDDAPASTTELGSRDVLSIPRRTAEDALRIVPGMTLVQHGSEGKGYQFFLRGFDAAHGSDLEVKVDGVPINEWSNIHGHGYVDLGFVPPELIERVEVTKGPFSLDQGAFALAGTARFELGVPLETRGLRAAYTAGTTHRHRGLFSYSPRDGDGKDFVAVDALFDAGFGSRRRIEKGTAIGKVRLFDSESKGTLTASLALNAAAFEIPGVLRASDVQAGAVGFRGSYDDGLHGASRRALVSLDYARRDDRGELGAKLWAGVRSLELLENYTGFLLDPERGDRRAQDQRTASFGAEASYALALDRRLTLLFEVGTRADVFDQRQTQVDFDTSAELGVQRDLRGAQSLTHGLLGVRAVLAPMLHVTGGVRLDVGHLDARDRLQPESSGSGTFAVASPRVVVSIPVSHHFEGTLAYGRGFRPPEARAHTSFMPDRLGVGTDVYSGGAPTSTKSDAMEIGARFRVNRYFFGEASGFATLVRRESVYDHVSGLNLALNRTRRVGAELRLASRPLDWLEVSVDGTAVDGRFVESDNPIPLAPRFFGTLRAIAEHPKGVRAGLRLMGFTPRPLPNGARGEAFATLDATLGYTRGMLRLDLELENLTNRRSREGEYHFASHWARGTAPSELPTLQLIGAAPLNARLTVTLVY